MTIEQQYAFLSTEHAEAVRYMDNARSVLAKSKKDGHYYVDKKYVRMACGTAYSGVLVALDAWLALKGIAAEPLQSPMKARSRNSGKNPDKKLRKKPRKSIDFYTDNIAKLDRKLLDALLSVYSILHLDGYYDGVGNGKTLTAGFETADDIIDRIKPFTAA